MAKKLVDTKQHCKYLAINEKYLTWRDDELYICALNQEPCIAVQIGYQKSLYNILTHPRFKIDEEKLKECSFRNFPVKAAKNVMLTRIDLERDQKIENLEERLKDIK